LTSPDPTVKQPTEQLWKVAIPACRNRAFQLSLIMAAGQPDGLRIK
jgi:hypothetical protein